MAVSHNIYVHVPFCMSKCNYCAFYSFACDKPGWKKYADDICNEIKFWNLKIGKTSVPTIFFGGGTPSLMPTSVFEQIMCCIYDNFIVDKDCEITIESNPGTINADKLSEFVKFGVNRLSIGVQSFKDSELLFLGRRHNVKQAKDLLCSAQNMGLRVSGDFIYGLPNHNVQSVIDLCKEINEIGLQHASLYELTIEPNTPFGKMNLDMPDNETMAQMYTAIAENLSLPRYEGSNYAMFGQECRHNQNIWDGAPYIGIGRGAAGRIFVNDTWYEQRGANELFEKMNDETRATEKILTGMRTVRGVKLTEDVKNQINFDWVNSHKDLVEINSEYLHTTANGMLILDDIITDLIK